LWPAADGDSWRIRQRREGSSPLGAVFWRSELFCVWWGCALSGGKYRIGYDRDATYGGGTVPVVFWNPRVIDLS